MKLSIFAAAACLVVVMPLAAQESKPKPVPKDSVRVAVPGCGKGYVFTAGPRSADEAGSADVPDGTRFRMNAPRKVMADIKAHEGSMVEITGLIRKGQFAPGGVNVGGGVRIGPAPAPSSGGIGGIPVEGPLVIDVESWRPLAMPCQSR